MVLSSRTLQRYRDKIGKIRALKDEFVREMVSAFENAPLTVSVETLVSELDLHNDIISRSDIEEILSALLSLCVLRDQSGSSTAEVAEDLAREVEENDADRSHLRDRLVVLLGLDALNLVAKSGALMVNQQRFFREAQILTDVRPVFGPAPEASPTGAVIVHTLKISCFENNEFKDFFVALDVNDVRTLSKVLARADSKAESLKSVLMDTPMRYVDAE